MTEGHRAQKERTGLSPRPKEMLCYSEKKGVKKGVSGGHPSRSHPRIFVPGRW